MLQRKAHIGGHRHVRIERVALEHHGDIAILRVEIVDDAAADIKRAASDGFEPGDHPQKGGLAAAGRTDQHDELAVVDLEIDAMDDVDGAIALADIGKGDLSHVGIPLFSP